MISSRQKNGQFAQGNPGGPGNPYAVRALHFKTLFQKLTTDEQFENVKNAVYEAAIAGNMKAAALFLETLKGKAEQAICDTTVNKPSMTQEEFDSKVRALGWVKPTDAQAPN